jgi:hypothetical protein
MTFAFNYFREVEPPYNLLHADTPSPEFHFELAEEMRQVAIAKGNSRLANASPRSHSKSTLAQIFLLWCIVYQEDLLQPYWIVINAKQAGAKGFLDVIKAQLEGNPLLREDFGDLVGKDTWNALEIVTKNMCKLEARGSGESMRGAR